MIDSHFLQEKVVWVRLEKKIRGIAKKKRKTRISVDALLNFDLLKCNSFADKEGMGGKNWAKHLEKEIIKGIEQEKLGNWHFVGDCTLFFGVHLGREKRKRKILNRSQIG